ncbi:MAG: Uma2 family endonuclease [Acidimicrobiales bacterium]
MPATEFSERDLVDPDQLTVPESPAHRQATELIAVLAQHLLGPDQTVYRNMNWYPLDEGSAMAPDVMVLPAGTLPPRAKSHRQASVGGPNPSVVVEVLAENDPYQGFRRKLQRFRQAGVVVYLVEVDEAQPRVARQAPDNIEAIDWMGRPLPELGGLMLLEDEGRLCARLPDGTTFRSNEDVLALLKQRAANAEAVAARAEAVATDAQARVAELEARLRALGLDTA